MDPLTDDDFDDDDAPPPPIGSAPATDATTDWKAEAEKYQKLMRKQEERAKANAAAARELAQVRQQSMTDLEKAVAIARTEARTEALREGGARLVDAEIRAATAGRSIDTKALLEGLDRSRFLDDDGEPNTEAIVKWIDRLAPAPDANRVPKVAAGPRGAPTQPVDMNALIRGAGRRS